MLKHKSLVLINLVLIIFSFFSLTTIAFGVQSYTPLAPLPGTTSCGPNSPPNQGCVAEVGRYISGMFKLIIGVATALSVIMITIGGIEIMSTDSISGKLDGKEKIYHALFGLLLAISAWLILYTINPETLNFRVFNNINNALPPVP